MRGNCGQSPSAGLILQGYPGINNAPDGSAFIFFLILHVQMNYLFGEEEL